MQSSSQNTRHPETLRERNKDRIFCPPLDAIREKKKTMTFMVLRGGHSLSFVVIMTLCFKLTYGIILNFLLYLFILGVSNTFVHVCGHVLSIACTCMVHTCSG